MRTPWAWLLAITACGGFGEPCDGEACQEVCADAFDARAAEGPDRASARQLTLFEAGLLGDELLPVLLGVVPAGPRITELCPAGAVACDAPVIGAPGAVVPAGRYGLQIALRVPPRGAWPMRFEHTCNPPAGRAIPEGGLSAYTVAADVELRAVAGQDVQRFVPGVAVDATDGVPRVCQWSLRAIGWTAPAGAEARIVGQYTAPGG